MPAPVGAVHLTRQPMQHDRLRIVGVEMRQVDERFAHALVENDRVEVLRLLAHNLAFVLHNQHLSSSPQSSSYKHNVAISIIIIIITIIAVIKCRITTAR